ncbi:hypothetical protein JCM10207_000528 [Rhodosporidiobolus poonsookiae]
MAAVLSTRRTAAQLIRPSHRTFFSFPSPFGSSSSSGSPPPVKKGTLVKQNGVWLYTENKLMPYSPQELYRVIADVDSYKDFLPFTTQSRVLSAVALAQDGKRIPQNVGEKGWLSDAGEQRWEMDAELRIGAMGFDEGYVSLVEVDKGKWVKATAKDASMFRHLSTLWSFSPAPTSSPSTPQTKVDLSLAYQFTSPLHAAAISTVWDKISALMVEKFEERVRAVHGRR